MLITTTDSIEGKPVTKYLGVVTTEIVFTLPSLSGTIEIGDFALETNNIVSGETHFTAARTQALEKVIRQANALNANAILSLRLNFQGIGAKNHVLLSATGTAVLIDKLESEKVFSHIAHDAKSAYFIKTKTGEKGPLFIEDIRALTASNSISADTQLRHENDEEWTTLANLLKDL